MTDVNELRQRRDALQAQLTPLIEQREHAFRENSDALAQQQAGVTHRDGAAMQQLADAQSAGDSTMTTLRRQIKEIDDELARDHRGGLEGGRRKIMSLLRR